MVDKADIQPFNNRLEYIQFSKGNIEVDYGIFLKEVPMKGNY